MGSLEKKNQEQEGGGGEGGSGIQYLFQKKKSLNHQCLISGRQSRKGLIRASQKAPAQKPLSPQEETGSN